MTSKSLGILVALVGTAGSPGMVEAQLVGDVVDSGGRPLSGVVVRAWGTGEVLGTTETDAVGRFRLDVADTDVRRLTAHLAGAPTAFVHDLDPPIRIVVVTQPFELEGVDVRAERELCTLPDDREARALLTAAAAGLSDETGMRGLGWGPRRRSATTPGRELPGEAAFRSAAEAPTDFHDAWSSLNGGAWGYRRIPRDFLPDPRGTFEDRVRDAGYAKYDPLIDGARPYPYPRLHEAKAYHFGTPVFTEVHDLALLTRDGDEAVIGFCPRSRQPGIRGRIHVRGDRLTSAEWTFLNSDGESLDAGGAVEFRIVTDGGGQRHLLAQYGRRWFASPERPGFYDVTETDFRYWQVSPTDESPVYNATRR